MKKSKIRNFIANNKFFIIGVSLVFLFLLPFDRNTKPTEITEKHFEDMLIADQISEISLVINKYIVEFTLKNKDLEEPNSKKKVVYSFRIPSIQIFNDNFQRIEFEKPHMNRIGYSVVERYDFLRFLENWGTFLISFAFLWFLIKKISGGSQMINIGKTKAVLSDNNNPDKVLFKHVAGLKEVKEEVLEVVDFLKNPEKYIEIGAKMPKGILLVGAPGTGKTLLARAVAGEADVAFFSLSGSDFVEMFVGVGAARVRDLFLKAREKAPCIIFIDEIDAIGRARGKNNLQGANDERENTLNSLLVEMDGFNVNSGIVVFAATNRPDVLDKALLRPGRFDRQISIDKPDIVDREEIFEFYLNRLPRKAPGISAKELASQTPGFVGADIGNICNEAALFAARNNSPKITKAHFNEALDRIIGGLEKKNKVILQEEKIIVAHHEAGHAIVGWFLEYAHPLVKVSIVPRGIAALGYAQYLPKEKFLYQEQEMLDHIAMALGGRVAEEIVFNKISTGALSDLESVTKLAYDIVGLYGMNDKIGHITFRDKNNMDNSFVKPYSERTAELIDSEVKKIVDHAYLRAKTLLISKKTELELVANALLEKEVLYQEDFRKLVGDRPWDLKKTESLEQTLVTPILV